MGDGAQGPAPSSCSRIKTSVMGAKKLQKQLSVFCSCPIFSSFLYFVPIFFIQDCLPWYIFVYSLFQSPLNFNILIFFITSKPFVNLANIRSGRYGKKSKLNSFLCIPFLMFDQGFGIPGLIKVIKCNQRAFNFGGSFQIEQPSLSKIRAIFRN